MYIRASSPCTSSSSTQPPLYLPPMLAFALSSTFIQSPRPDASSHLPLCTVHSCLKSATAFQMFAPHHQEPLLLGTFYCRAQLDCKIKGESAQHKKIKISLHFTYRSCAFSLHTVRSILLLTAFAAISSYLLHFLA